MIYTTCSLSGGHAFDYTISTIYYLNPYTNPDVTSAGQVWWVALTRDTSGYGFAILSLIFGTYSVREIVLKF
jgi:hypothetical protein